MTCQRFVTSGKGARFFEVMDSVQNVGGVMALDEESKQGFYWAVRRGALPVEGEGVNN